MLSLEKNSDPSSSSKISSIGTDEKAPQGLVCQEADPLVVHQTTPPNFSMRNYVFASRGKDIETNWPFSHPFLKHCLKNGIKDVLPPFEPPNLVRAWCCRKLEEPDQLIATPETAKASENANLLEPENISSSDGKYTVIRQRSRLPCEEQFVESLSQSVSPSSENWKCEVNRAVNLDELIHTNDPIVSSLASDERAELSSAPVSGISCTVAVDRSASESPLESETKELSEELEKSQQPSEKKCKLIVKLTAISEASQMDDLTSNATAVSDSMASKVCPVCKAFSSSSNTTLNAHIDQCLFVESNTKSMNSLPKLKMKPRKKRLMVDIYADAAHCTLEDLDRRNGTNWAMELALSVAPPGEALPEAKRQKLALTGPRDDAVDDAVYVDSNGIKLRILSKFNDTPLPKEDPNVKNNTQENNTEKDKYFGPKFTKKMNMKSQKKSASLKVLKHQMQHIPEQYHDTENNQTIEECLSNSRDVRITDNDRRRSTLRQWKNSKDSKSFGKLSTNDTYDSMRSMRSARRNLPSVDRHSDQFDSYILRRPAKKVLKLTSVLTGSPKTKSVDFLRRPVNTRSNENRSLESPTSDSEQFSGSSLSGNENFLPDLLRSSKAFLSIANKGLRLHTRINERSKHSSHTTNAPKICASKHNSESTFMKNQFTDMPYFSLEPRRDEADDKPSSPKTFRKNRSKNLRTSKRTSNLQPPRLHSSIISQEFANVRNSENLWNLNAGTSKNIGRLDIRNGGSPIKRTTQEYERGDEDDILTTLPLETEVEISEEQVDFVNAVNCVTSHSESLEDTCMEKDMEAFLSIEASGSDKKETTGSDADLQGAQVVAETKAYDDEDAVGSQPILCQANATSAQESSGCLTSHQDSELDEPNINSLSTSSWIEVNKKQNLDGAEKPVGSTISLPSPKDSETKSVVSDSSIQDGLNVFANSSSKNRCSAEKEGKESDQILNASNNVKGNDKITEEKAFCCSCRESLSRESFLKKNTNATTGKVKPVSNLVIRPGHSSSFTKYQSRTANIPSSSSSPSAQPTSSQNILDSSLKYPYHGDVSSPSPTTQSPSNATLRLMGKNLVLNHSEHSQPQTHVPVYQPAASTSTAGIPFANDLWLDHFHYPQFNQFMSRTAAFGQVASVTSHQMPTLSGFAAPLFTGNRTETILDQQKQAKMHGKSNSYKAPYNPQEVIVIDDSPERGSDLNSCITSPNSTLPLFTPGLSPLPQVQSSYFPLQNPAFEVSAPLINMYPIVYPRVNSTSFIDRGNSSDYQGPILPSQVVFRSSTGPMTSSMFYSETMH